MLLKKLVILFIASIYWLNVHAQLPKQVFQTIEGKNFSFESSLSPKGWVLFFLLPDCPMCQNYSLTINKLVKEYSGKGFSFITVFPGKAYSKVEIQSYLKNYKVSTTAITDPAFILADALQASVTPQAFIVSPNGKTLYSGKIDNWMYAVGKKRQVITANYLKDAIENVINNQAVKIPQTAPVGCFIK